MSISRFLFLLTLIFSSSAFARDRPILTCPPTQPAARNGAKPNPEVLKELVRCKKGEKAAEKGYDGAVTVDVAAIQIGQPRKWSYQQDIGNGALDTVVYPAKVTYSVRTHYRTRIAAEDNWIRVINFYVNSFGEWQAGSEEPVKSPDVKSIPK